MHKTQKILHTILGLCRYLDSNLNTSDTIKEFRTTVLDIMIILHLCFKKRYTEIITIRIYYIWNLLQNNRKNKTVFELVSGRSLYSSTFTGLKIFLITSIYTHTYPLLCILMHKKTSKKLRHQSTWFPYSQITRAHASTH